MSEKWRKKGLMDPATWWDDPNPGRRPGGPNKFGWPVFSLIFLLPFDVPAIQDIVRSDSGPAAKAVLLTLVIAYSACYALFPWVWRSSRPIRYGFCAGMLAVGVTVAGVMGPSPFVVVYATAVAVFLLPTGLALILDVAAFATMAVIMLANGVFADKVGEIGSAASVTLAMFFMVNLIRAVTRLEMANEEIATLAVTSERERVARDLHDILGHSLTTITVKAGVARRILESNGDVPRAVEEIREVESLTRSALSDVRATVSEYREVSLSAELVGARAALRAAEIDADLPHAVDNVRPEFQRPFGYVLREAVTNILRHSGAERVKVRLGRNWIEIEDDGAAKEVKPGNGLRGLNERLEAVGGTIQASVRSGGGLVVRAEIPLPEPSTVTPAVRAEPAGGLA